jgi:FtsZ-interacting cell division protein ZipA
MVSTGLIFAIVVVAIILIALLVLVPRLRAKASEKRRERELVGRRKEAAGEHRQVAQARSERAAEAEQHARIAEQEARREKAEAQLQQERASAYERGLADHELVGEQTGGAERYGDGQHGADGAPRTSAYEEGRRSAHEPWREEDFHAGRSGEEDGGGNGGLLGRFKRKREREPSRQR